MRNIRKKNCKRNIRKKNSPLKKKDRILFAAAILLLSFAVAFFTAACVIFIKGNDDSDHSRFFTACVLLFSGGVSALGASAALLFTPLMQSRRNGICPYCGAKVSKKAAFCPSCGKRLAKSAGTEDLKSADTTEEKKES